MKISIEKELEEQRKEKLKKLNIVLVNQVKELLANNDAENVRILRGLSDKSELNRIEKLTGEQMELEKIENKYAGNVFTRDQIKKLAVDYKLRFLRSRNYTGSYDTQLATKIKQFAQVNEIQITEHVLENSFYILAREEMFKMTDKRYVSPKQLDPVIFYRINENTFRLVHKWGADFTITRLLKGFKWKNIYYRFFYYLALFYPIIFNIPLFVSDEPAAMFSNHFLLLTFGGLLMSSITSFLGRVAYYVDDEKNKREYFTPHNWDSEYKLIY